MRFGAISPPVPGHLNPFCALGREFERRGHQMVFYQMADVGERIRREGLGFQAIGASDHPVGTLPRDLEQLGRLKGLAALRFTIAAVERTTRMICRDAPAAIRADGLPDLMLVDQTEPAGGAVAEHLGIPFVTVCAALPIHREDVIPPAFSAWRYNPALWAVLRNRLGYAVSARMLRPVTRVLDDFRNGWGLEQRRSPDEHFSTLAQISQQVSAFEYPRVASPSHLHLLGPFRDPQPEDVAFPWDRLDSRPLVYASLGTLQGGSEAILSTIAESCSGVNAQLVISHGGRLPSNAVARFPSDVVVVDWAPQRALLNRASLAVTHGGFNTVLDALAASVPLVVIPLTYEQPAIAARVEWAGAGRCLPRTRLSAERLRAQIVDVLSDVRYRSNSRRIAEQIAAAGGVASAADIVELAAQTRRPVPAEQASPPRKPVGVADSSQERSEPAVSA